MMAVASGYVTLDTRECRSLKEKRSILNSLMGKARSRFNNVSLAEVGNADYVRSITIGIAVVSGDQAIAETILGRVIAFLEEYSFRMVTDSAAEVHILEK
jgi:uncharacterized protein YlxP (DUF503 family)